MPFGLPVLGDCKGRIMWNTEDMWVVTVLQYTGWRHGSGHVWQGLSAHQFFRLDVLARQLREAGIAVDVEFRLRRCVLIPNGAQAQIRTDGRRIAQFMTTHYGTFGPKQRPVRWKWGFSNDDW